MASDQTSYALTSLPSIRKLSSVISHRRSIAKTPTNIGIGQCFSFFSPHACLLIFNVALIYSLRNDDLYKATTEKSTTGSGLAPLFDRNLYKRPAPGSPMINPNSKNNQPLQPLITKDTFKPEAPPQAPGRGVIGDVDYIAPAVQRPARPLRPARPYRRRRPQIDYYYYDDEEYDDDFYDDRSRRRQRPRNRRPIYDDYRFASCLTFVTQFLDINNDTKF